ncbi:MAG: hypothetical protein HY902_08335 [Deltaproteobacteria bacterium]|nr:hypothetical protein [Deltaproteobacteria bacterium]
MPTWIDENQTSRTVGTNLGARALRRLAAAATLLVALALSGCGNDEFDQVRSYKEFLVKAKPSLQSMNKVREELYNADSVDTMIAKFEFGLLPNVQTLHDLTEAEQVPEGKLKEVHDQLKTTMDAYLTATKSLVTTLKGAKTAHKADEAAFYGAVEKALLEWGSKDKDFGDKMSNLVSDLNAYLDKLVKS